VKKGIGILERHFLIPELNDDGILSSTPSDAQRHLMNWDDIREWRSLMRAQMRSKRRALPGGEKESVRLMVSDFVRDSFPELRDACIGFYWPFQGEIDLRHRVGLALGAEAGLPIVVEKGQPLEFWSRHPGMKLRRGIWNIPLAVQRNPIQPTVLLVPLVGFDLTGYRLGHGGGYYDRTLATFIEKPLTIGIGYELGRLETIHPQPHDITHGRSPKAESVGVSA
jgi:5-formyltetrahydrofolate cyclo-ligase